MGYYCSNYYGSIHCHNTVSRFGDRCHLCAASKRGAAIKEGLLSEAERWGSATPRSTHGDRRVERASRPARDSRVKN
ncbi:hypothetical protein CGCF415_v003777 [Colletotrichum fructicola]|uniref:Uncharacterized protein n=5 Tax=Colletotrichum gloeosporioides species complex TaxID=2707338 RepID=T0KXV5_COLGC|nr:uncharacterized protein CGMCC3_g1137 [Colletotrichum fructicola]XP_036490514.1 uncharacterized protein CGCS363_v012093 [Colletotrichum siamense]XP_037174513.1 uncharacterized protein CGCA056_v012035 [Colletotrichum aenigma]EQB57019.1 hypothetical protein CGLO_02902 [Colletotrichum gloeosporioides Cg-14]KAF4481307.1 hypothetical protein CGGC5_v010845 [Colletotrichum fructicola Nara gc5]KAF4828954.1 hypothetical protein CGCTS75_v007066 [Colletotrichum tropicale]KAF4898620.1 hypothetical prot